MKKHYLLVALLFSFFISQAQTSTAKKEPNALTKIAMLKLSGAGIPNDVSAKTYATFYEFYAGKAQAEAAIANGESNLKLAEVQNRYIKNRDASLAKILSAEQMKLFKTKLEAALAFSETK